MNRFLRLIRGVTLLEIMLVLAIAAMIVVMSIRYYQSASTTQQANAAVGQIQSVMAAVDNLGMNGGYNNTYVTDANVSGIVGANNMKTPTGGTITLGGSPTATTYSLTVPLNAQICQLVLSKMINNPKITGSCSGGTYTMNYDNSK